MRKFMNNSKKPFSLRDHHSRVCQWIQYKEGKHDRSDKRVKASVHNHVDVDTVDHKQEVLFHMVQEDISLNDHNDSKVLQNLNVLHPSYIIFVML